MRAAMHARTRGPRAWQEVTGSSQFLLHVTPDELKALDEELTSILVRHRDRIANPDERPAASEPVEVLVFAYRVTD